jgi:hypothetical protein
MVTWSLKKTHLGWSHSFYWGAGGVRQLVKIRHKLNPAYEDVEQIAIILKKI